LPIILLSYRFFGEEAIKKHFDTGKRIVAVVLGESGLTLSGDCL